MGELSSILRVGSKLSTTITLYSTVFFCYTGIMILIGSRAIKYWFPEFPREPKDWDYIDPSVNKLVTMRQEDKTIDLHPISRFFPDWTANNVLSPNQLYTLKMSHIFWDIHWDKNIFDIQFLKRKGCTLIPGTFEKLYKHWNKVHGVNKRSNLNMSKQQFFTNGIKNGHQHDSLHVLIKDPPTYTKILEGEVSVSETLWRLLSYDDKLALAQEEAYVMAYERLAGRHYRVAYAEQLKALIISHAPLYQAIFIAENYEKLKKPTINYQKHLYERTKETVL